MTTPPTGKLILNIGKLSNTRFKFSFATDEGTLFCEISLPAAADGILSDEQRKREAVAKLKRLLEGISTVVKGLD
jgi:hypothetical protein